MQYPTLLVDILALQFLLGSEHIPSRVYLLVLRNNSSRLVCRLLLQRSDACIEICNSLVKLCNMDVLLLKFGLKLLQLRIIILKLLNKIIYHRLELITTHTTLTHLLTEFCYEFTIMLHHLGDATDILSYHFSLIRSLTALYDRHPTLGSINQPESLLNLIHRAKDIIYLPVLEIYDLLERIAHRIVFIHNRRISLLLTRSQKHHNRQYG